MEDMPEDASVTMRKAGAEWTVRVVGNGEVIEEGFDSEEAAEAFAAGHRIRLGLKVQQDVS
jgi:hypothetical protein